MPTMSLSVKARGPTLMCLARHSPRNRHMGGHGRHCDTRHPKHLGRWIVTKPRCEARQDLRNSGSTPYGGVWVPARAPGFSPRGHLRSAPPEWTGQDFDDRE